MLGFQADGAALLVNDAFFADYRAVQEVAGIDLDAGFVGIYDKPDATGRTVELAGRTVKVSVRVQAPVVVEALAVSDLVAVGGNVPADGFGGGEIEGRIGHGTYNGWR